MFAKSVAFFLLSIASVYGQNLTQFECEQHCVTLNNGQQMPIVGLGTSRLAATEQLVEKAIKDAIEVGYRHIDTADFYKNENSIGDGLRKLMEEEKIKRSQLFVTTKVWSNNHTPNRTLASIKASLEKLGLDYLDLVLVHWPMTFESGPEYIPKYENGSIRIVFNSSEENFFQCYAGLEAAVDQGLVRSIGVSNFKQSQLDRLLAVARIRPTVNQIESHPLLSQKDLVDYCQSENITVVAYSPLRRADPVLLESQTLKTIAASHQKTVAQVLLRWQIQRGVLVIPKTSKRVRMVENSSVFDFELTTGEMEQISKLNTADGGGRLIRFEETQHSPEYPF